MMAILDKLRTQAMSFEVFSSALIRRLLAALHIQGTCRAIRMGQPFRDACFFPMFLFVYVTSFALVFFVQAKFWDDLALTNNPDIIRFFYQAGLPTSGYLLRGIMAINIGNLPLKLFVFCSFLITCILFRYLMLVLRIFTDLERNAATLLVAALPLFQSRFLLATAYYAFCLPLFVAGMLLLVSAIQKKKKASRLLAYLLLALSFFTQSLLVLYFFALFIVSIAQSRELNFGARGGMGAGLVDLARVAPDAFFFPFAFFLIKAFAFPTSGPFVGYNSFSFSDITSALFGLPTSTMEALGSVVLEGPSWPTVGLAAFCFLSFLTVLLKQRRVSIIATAAQRPSAISFEALLIAALGVMSSVLPYTVVHRTPSPFDFDDRHQLTMVLTTGPFVLVAIMNLGRASIRWFLVLFVLIWAVAYNLETYVAVVVDAHTQNAVVREFARSELIGSNSTFVVDTTQWPNLSRHRTLSTPQLNCLMKEAFGDESRFAVGIRSTEIDWNQELSLMNRFKQTGTCFRDFHRGQPFLVQIVPGTRHLNWATGIWLSLVRLVAPQRYDEQLRNVIKVSVVPAPDRWFVGP
jgi:hypothetical protein